MKLYRFCPAKYLQVFEKDENKIINEVCSAIGGHLYVKSEIRSGLCRYRISSNFILFQSQQLQSRPGGGR